jgi:ESCRT-I complex subunit VPS37
LQEELYKLRSETKDAFDEAKSLEARWAELQREQREVYQVRYVPWIISFLLTGNTAIHASIPLNATPTCNDGTGRLVRGAGIDIRTIHVV